MIIESIKRYPALQFLLFGMLLLAYWVSSSLLWEMPLTDFSPLFDLGELAEKSWFKVAILSLNLLLLMVIIFELSSLLRNHHFAGESKMEQILFAAPFVLLFPETFYNLPLLFTCFLLLRSFRFLFLVHTQIRISRELALMAFYMSICSMLFPPAAFLALLIYIGVLLQRGFYFKELVLFLVVFALPFYFLYAILFLFDLPMVYDFSLVFQGIDLKPLKNTFYLKLALLILLSVLMFFSFSYNSKEVLRSKAQFRNFYYLFYFSMIWMLVIKVEEGIGIALVPALAIYVQSYPRLRKKWIIEAALLLIFVLALIFQLLTYYSA